MSGYNEKFSAIYHEYHKSKMKKLSIGTEGIFDFFKKKKKEEPKEKEKEKSIADFVDLFTEEFGVVEKKIQESEQTEWVIDSSYVGKAKTPQELINSVKAHVVFLKEMQSAMDMVIRGIDECNNYTKAWSKDPDNTSLRIKGVDKIAKYRVLPKHFHSLDLTGKSEDFVALGDKFRSFTMTLNVVESPHRIGYDNIPEMRGSFKFTKDSEAKITLTKSEFISFMKELKNVNSCLGALYKDYLNPDSAKFDGVIADADRIYGHLVDADNDLDLDEAYGVSENYYQGHYTGLCQETAEQYVKYMHSFLK